MSTISIAAGKRDVCFAGMMGTFFCNAYIVNLLYQSFIRHQVTAQTIINK